jgi:peroxiredoxin
VALQGRLDSARRGEIPPEVVPEEWAFKSAVAVGQRVPDFIVTDLTGKNSVRLGHLLGRPVLVFFYNPATATGQEVLHFALELNKKHGTQLGIMAMAVTQDVDFVRKQHTALRLPFAILDGNGMHQTFGVDATPRLVVLDGDGILRCAATGWGIQTPREIAAELLRCMSK